ncbi:MAG: hypothetical protein P8Y70_16085 [Candidatus Lokiarchaeota archaeon]
MFKFIKNYFKQDDIESIEKLEEELEELKENSGAQLISFIGVDDKIKGIDLIHFTDDSIDTRFLAGIFANFYHNLKIIKHKILKSSLIPNVIETKGKILFFYPITPIVVTVCILPNSDSISKLSKWILKNEARLQQYFKT